MSNQKKKQMTQSSVLLGGLQTLENKQNLNGDEIKEMIQLLKAYEALCIQREDFNGADSVKNKIQQLKDQELLQRKQTIAIREKEHIEVICKEGEKDIKQFQANWDIQIKALIEDLKRNEEELVNIQKCELSQFMKKVEQQEPPKVKFSSHLLEKRKYLSNLIKTRNYKQAEVVKHSLKQMQTLQQMKWIEKIQQKKQLKILKLEKKQMAELQAFRVKLQGIFNEKIKERDRKFDILLKKNRKRRVESSKASRERISSKNGVLSEMRMSQSKVSRSFYQKYD